MMNLHTRQIRAHRFQGRPGCTWLGATRAGVPRVLNRSCEPIQVVGESGAAHRQWSAHARRARPEEATRRGPDTGCGYLPRRSARRGARVEQDAIVGAKCLRMAASGSSSENRTPSYVVID